MSKIAEEAALKAYNHFTAENIDDVLRARHFFQKGYDQSAKDTIERIRAGVKKLRCTFGEVTMVDVFELLSNLEKEYE